VVVVADPVLDPPRWEPAAAATSACRPLPAIGAAISGWAAWAWPGSGAS